MKRIFETAASYPFSPEIEKVVLVPVNGAAVITANSLARYAVTSDTNVCAGLALTSSEASALTHIYSDMKFFPEGKDRVTQHARFAWEEFEKILPDDIRFNAVAFGGRNSFPGIRDKFPGYKAIDAYMEKALIAEQEYHEVENSTEYKKLQAIVTALRGREEFCELGLEESIQLGFAQKKIEDMYEEPYRELNKGKLHKTGLYMAAHVSKWIGDEFYTVALQSGRIHEYTDLRFQSAPHDAIVDHETGSVVIGRSGENSPLKNPYHRGYPLASTLFDGYGLQSLSM